MKIHEYQAKAVLAAFGVVVPRGIVADTADGAVEAARKLGGDIHVVKAQVHAGGRGKGGGVRIARGLDQVRQYAEAMLGTPLVTHQTGPKGQDVKRVYIEEGIDITREIYLGLVLDRETRTIVIMASRDGGMDIEEVARNTPERILKENVDPVVGLMSFQVRNIIKGLGLTGSPAQSAGAFLSSVYRAFTEKDATLVEINPLVVTGDGRLVALDAKMMFDDNALFRHPDIAQLRDVAEEDPLEVRASEFDLSYIKLDGDIGNLVNGAGLAMATMDIIKYYGGEPANFLDVGGSASREKVKAAFEIILADHPKAILVNIFGGIMKCDVIADGVLSAVRDVDLSVPLVVRLQGTNSDEGLKIIADSDLKVITAETMSEAAQKVVSVAKGV